VGDKIIMQPSGAFMPTGLYTSAFYLRDALAMVGVEMDVIAITPYKGALDQFSQAGESAETAAQIGWILDSRYQQIVSAIAAGRGVSTDAVTAMIDGGIYTDQQALDAGYLDGLVYEEDLPAFLNATTLVSLQRAVKRLKIPPPLPFSPDAVAIIPIMGMMMDGESAAPPVDLPFQVPVVGDETAGSDTIVRQIRAVIEDDSAKAVVLYVDSGGGAVTAASAMGRALEALAKTRPIVVYMHSVAASGGYWVATPSQWIMAQAGTITGSIGVVLGKAVASRTPSLLHIGTSEHTRGANADVFSTSRPFSESQRAAMRAGVEHTYREFVQRVADSRHMTFEQVDAISGGRVWTGEQALANGLIDEIGDLRGAIRKARSLANLPDHAPTFLVEADDAWIPPQAKAEIVPAAARSADGILYALRNAQRIGNARAQVILPWRLR
jgi:protease IV